MRKLLLAALALNIGCASAPPKKASVDHGGTRRTLLANKGDVREALLTLFTRDPQYTVAESGNVITVAGVLTAYLEPGTLGDETDIEIVCENRAQEKEWLDKLPEAVKYLALDHIPDLRSPLDEGPRAVEAPRVPAIDAVRRY